MKIRLRNAAAQNMWYEVSFSIGDPDEPTVSCRLTIQGALVSLSEDPLGEGYDALHGTTGARGLKPNHYRTGLVHVEVRGSACTRLACKRLGLHASCWQNVSRSMPRQPWSREAPNQTVPARSRTACCASAARRTTRR